MAIPEETLFLPIRELGARLRKKQFSAVELTQAYLDRLEQWGTKLGAVVTITKDLALEQARQADRDFAASRSRPAPRHSVRRERSGRHPRHSDDVGSRAASQADLRLRRHRRHASCAKPARSWWRSSRWSNSRAASATTTPTPASPARAGRRGTSTTGRAVPRPGPAPPPPRGSSPSRSARKPPVRSSPPRPTAATPHCGRPTGASADMAPWRYRGRSTSSDLCADPRRIAASSSPPSPAKTHATRPRKTSRSPIPKTRPAKFRVGVIRDCTKDIQPAVRDNFEESLKILAKFCDIVENVPYPESPFGPVVSTIINAEGASALRTLIESGQDEGAENARDALCRVLGVDGARRSITCKRCASAARNRVIGSKRLYVGVRRAGEPVAEHGVVSRRPELCSESTRSIRERPARSSPPGISAGQPSLSVPNGFGPNNLPTGIQFTGKCWSEPRLLSLADAYQQATDWHQRRPRFDGRAAAVEGAIRRSQRPYLTGRGPSHGNPKIDTPMSHALSCTAPQTTIAASHGQFPRRARQISWAKRKSRPASTTWAAIPAWFPPSDAWTFGDLYDLTPDVLARSIATRESSRRAVKNSSTVSGPRLSARTKRLAHGVGLLVYWPGALRSRPNRLGPIRCQHGYDLLLMGMPP